MKAIRHGDLLLVETEKLPSGLTVTDTDIIMHGSNGNAHKAVDCKLYLHNEGQFIIGHLVTGEKACLLHKEHGKGKGEFKKAPLPANKIYELRRQVEDTHDGMKPVID